MEITPKSRFWLRAQSLLFTLLFLAVIGTLAWLSTRYQIQTDWTASGRNTLTSDSRKILENLDAPVRITAFARDNDFLRKQISDTVARYQRMKADIQLEFINPDSDPEQIRQLGISLDGELLLQYQGRSEKVQQLNEQTITNALQRLARQGERWIVFLSGHGERDPLGKANHDLGNFGSELQRKGLQVQTLNLALSPSVPDNTSLLVIASPQTAVLPGEAKLIRDFLNQGGNLLWLAEPDQPGGLEPIAEDLGVEFLPGRIVDASTQLFGINNPAFVLVPEYPMHAITRELTSMTVFPEAVALEAVSQPQWNIAPFLTTLERTWTELGPLEGDIRYDADSDERAGPLDIGLAYSREGKPGEAGGEPRQQRVAVLGDGDFLANAYLGNGANFDLGLNLINWLSHDDAFLAIRAKTAPDLQLNLSGRAQAIIAIGFLLVLPALLLFAGFGIWLRRRGR